MTAPNHPHDRARNGYLQQFLDNKHRQIEADFQIGRYTPHVRDYLLASVVDLTPAGPRRQVGGWTGVLSTAGNRSGRPASVAGVAYAATPGAAPTGPAASRSQSQTTAAAASLQRTRPRSTGSGR